MRIINFILIFFLLCGISLSAKDSNQIIKISKDYILLMENGAFDQAVKYFDKTMKKALPESKLKAIWNDLIKKQGSFEEFDKIKNAKKAEYDIILLTCRFKKSMVVLKVVFNQKKEISGFWLASVKPHKE